jgi:hypothetical protein
MNPRERQEKITRMKMQTVKVLWQEDRKDAAALVLESIDDPRADELAERMGFAGDYEIGISPAGNGQKLQIAGLVIIVGLIAFTLGFIVSPDSAPVMVEVTPAGDTEQVLQTIVAPTPAAGETLSEPLLNLTGTMAFRESTAQAIRTQQSNMSALISASETARVINATGTAVVTQSAGD